MEEKIEKGTPKNSSGKYDRKAKPKKRKVNKTVAKVIKKAMKLWETVCEFTNGYAHLVSYVVCALLIFWFVNVPVLKWFGKFLTVAGETMTSWNQSLTDFMKTALTDLLNILTGTEFVCWRIAVIVLVFLATIIILYMIQQGRKKKGMSAAAAAAAAAAGAPSAEG